MRNMSATITINLSDEQSAKLSEMAERLNVRTEDLARAGIEEMLTASDEKFERAVEYTLRKNAELYRRLA